MVALVLVLRHSIEKLSKSLFHFSMKTLSVMDSTPGAVYPKIVSIVNEELFSLQVCKMRNVYFRLGTE